jgi:ankyrin repeat protein
MQKIYAVDENIINDFFEVIMPSNNKISALVSMNPLMIVACLSHSNHRRKQMMKDLIEMGANIESQDYRGITLLGMACKFSNAEAVKEIVELYLDIAPGNISEKQKSLEKYINLIDDNGDAALNLAGQNKSKEIVMFLARNGGVIDLTNKQYKNIFNYFENHADREEIRNYRREYLLKSNNNYCIIL